MFYGAIALLAVDLILMGGILFILTSKKTRFSRPLAAAEAEPVMMEIKKELTSVKKTAALLEKKGLDLAAYERSLQEKHRRIEVLLKEAEGSLPAADIVTAANEEDAYSKAMRLVKMGTPADEIVKRLGLMNGEVELISALSNYKS